MAAAVRIIGAEKHARRSFKTRVLAVAGQVLLTAAGASAGVSAGLVRVLTTPSVAHAFTAPSAVTEINSNNVTSGFQFGGRIQNFGVDPVNPLIVYAATELGGIYRSTDGGNNWAHVDAIGLTAASDVKVAPTDSNLIVAVGFYDGHTAANGGGDIWVSRDTGATWTRAARPDTCTIDPASNAVAIAPGTPGSIFIAVADNCGLVTSSNSGLTWTGNDPSGGSTFNTTDVKARIVGGQVQLDVCGEGGFFRSNNAGGTWTARDISATRPINRPGTFPPCYTAVAPQDPNTVLLSSWTQDPTGQFCNSQILENDSAGSAGNWVNLNGPFDSNCRASQVITHPAYSGLANQFELYWGTNSRFTHQTCDTNNTPRCGTGGAFSTYDNSIGAVHNAPDAHDLAFLPVPANACPFLHGGDAGVFRTTDGCNSSPSFAISNAGLHALQASQMAGTVFASHTDLYMGLQDNGLWYTNDGGTGWTQQGPDVYATYADHDGSGSTKLLWLSCFGCSVNISNPGGTGTVGFSNPPSGDSVPDNFHATQFGPQSYAFVTPDGPVSGSPAPPPPTWRTWVTTNAGGSWTQMGGTIPANTPPFDIKPSGPAAAPTFYLRLNVAGTPQLSRLQGPMNSTATYTALTNGISSVGSWGVSPANPLNLYATDFAANRMVRTTDGGASWVPDNALTSLVTSNNQLRFFDGFFGAMTTAVDFDGNSNTILVGTATNGLFASVDGGADWITVRGSKSVSRPTNFFFDQLNNVAFAGSAGRGMWKVKLPSADLAITKTAPSPAIAGQHLTYTLGVKNNGPDAASKVVVTDNLPSTETFLSSTGGCTESPSGSGQLRCPQADMASGASASFTIEVLIHSNVDLGGGPVSIANTANVSSGEAIDPNPADNSATATVIVNDQADLVVTKVCDTGVPAGQTGRCTVFVDNAGPSDARSVVLTDKSTSSGTFTITAVTPSQGTCTPPAGGNFTCNLGNLAAASVSTSGRATVQISYSATEAQTINDLASAVSATPDPNTSNNAASSAIAYSAVTDLRITSFTASPTPVTAGTTLTYTATVQNFGPSTAVNVVYRQALPAGVTVNSVTSNPAGTPCQAGVPGDPLSPATCGFDVMGPGATRTITIVVTVKPQTTGSLHSDANVTSDTFDPDNSNNFAHNDTAVAVHADIALSITESPNPVVAGRTMTFTATIVNNGPSTARGVTLTETLPPGTTLAGTMISNGSVGTCALVIGDPHTLQCQLNDLDPGASAMVFTTVNVGSSVPNGTVLTLNGNAQTTSGDPNLANNTASASATVRAVADLAISLSGPSIYKPSTTVAYVLGMTNSGPSDAVGVVVTQNLPPPSIGHYVSDNSGGLCVLSGSTLTCSLGTLPAGASRQIQVNYFIQGNAKLVTSTASVTSPTTDPNSANNSASWSMSSK
jgi:uncharacterized repeat protein (TIGR01451 family)